MTTTVLKRQFITDSLGNPIGVILPMEEFALVEEMLEQRLLTSTEADKLSLIEQATQDPLFYLTMLLKFRLFPGPRLFFARVFF